MTEKTAKRRRVRNLTDAEFFAILREKRGYTDALPVQLTAEREADAARLIVEAEEKAVRLFRDWKSLERHTLAEGDPEILKQLRREWVEHGKNIFDPYLDYEGLTPLELLANLKFILGEVEAGRDTRSREYITILLAYRMRNAAIIEYLTQLI